MIPFGVDVIEIVKQTRSIKGLLLLRKEIIETVGMSHRTKSHVLELIAEQIQEIDVKEMIISLFNHLL